MSAESHLPYSPLYIKAWTLLSIILGVILFGMFVFGDSCLLPAGNVVWSILRWICSPII